MSSAQVGLHWHPRYGSLFCITGEGAPPLPGRCELLLSPCVLQATSCCELLLSPCDLTGLVDKDL